MAETGLSVTQRRILRVLAGLEPRWVLFGGAALLATARAHRTTRDLDLRWAGRAELGEIGDDVQRQLAAAGFVVEPVQVTPAFQRLRVRGADEVVVDLVASPVPEPTELATVEIDGAEIPVPVPRDQLAEKLCALLGRAELRDLEDVAELLQRGQSLPPALVRAAEIDGGFSPMTLAWVLRGSPIAAIARREGRTAEQVAELERTRDGLVAELVELAEPDGGRERGG